MEDTTIHAKSPGSALNSTSRYAETRSPNQEQSLPSLLSFVHDQSSRPITLRFEDLAYAIKSQSGEDHNHSSQNSNSNSTRTLLNGVSGVVRPGEMLAMLGPSGSGKTTLITALAGRLPGKILGSITYSGQPFTNLIKRKTGFVAQDDVLYPHLTVIETLSYAALLRLPKNLTREEKIQQAEIIITELGLTTCRDSIVGGPLIRGVSGGERKRVSIGQEMLVNPSLLLLDEPTSGLDSTTALRIIATLKGLARGGRSVVTTIHQPSSRLYWMFDKVVVLSDGCPIYSGQTGQVMEYFSSIGHVPRFNFVNPADFLLDLANDVSPTRNQDEHPQDNQGRLDNIEDRNSIKQFLISSYKTNLQQLVKDDIHQHFYDTNPMIQETSHSRSCDKQWTTSWWMQFKVLLKRGLRERIHESYSRLRIFQVMSVSILSGLLWWHSDLSQLQDQVGLLFFFSIFWGFYPLSNAVFTFPQERPMLTREQSSGMYRLSSYYFARMAGDLPMELVLPTIFVTVTYWMGGLKHSFVTYILTTVIILFNVLVSQGLGLALGAILDLKQATTLSSVIMLVFLLAGGYYVRQIPPFISWLKYISFSHYCYKLLVEVQYTEHEVYECGIGVHCRVFDYPGIKHLGMGNLWWDVAALGVMLTGYRIIAYVALRMIKLH
ncbi:putative ABC transporter, AAA+ ATPase domain, ABC-2 type transporter [Helianthus annuus]|uniref:AAA+ ATPase domain, ABC transporter, G1 n=1 Tax=Helianthus annuus TaxID=4232 RepID=A0A251S878_HELAN|nr:ABC transporter G family member 21 [Helianthus annuus]KAF5764049.1 putative AAA+ ATPase domain, ABC transporter, G1 [Helianthus annuus]KAJ0844199.1 putative ABC transporter, AAA+ ATPase domain, ABC-2 type transporter [Helianthus annuus]